MFPWRVSSLHLCPGGLTPGLQLKPFHSHLRFLSFLLQTARSLQRAPGLLLVLQIPSCTLPHLPLQAAAASPPCELVSVSSQCELVREDEEVGGKAEGRAEEREDGGEDAPGEGSPWSDGT